MHTLEFLRNAKFHVFKLFTLDMHVQELGLRDAAVIEGWVELPEEEEASSSSSAEDVSEGQAAPALALPSLQHRLYPRTKAELTPADLEKAARVHEDSDPSFDLQGEYLSDGTEVRSICHPILLPVTIVSLFLEAFLERQASAGLQKPSNGCVLHKGPGPGACAAPWPMNNDSKRSDLVLRNYPHEGMLLRVQGYKRIFDEAEAKVMWMETLLSMPPPEVDDPSDLPPESLCRCAPHAPTAHPHLSREVSHPCRVRHLQGSKQAYQSTINQVGCLLRCKCRTPFPSV